MAHDTPPQTHSAQYLIFSQVELDAASLIRAAQRLNPTLRPHQLELDVGGFNASLANIISARLLVRAAFGEQRGEYLLCQRAPSAEDQAAAERAEVSGKAYGMSQLSARCPWVWELSAAAADPATKGSAGATAAAEATPEQMGGALTLDRPLTLLLCALLAGVALGPVMPPERDTLYGVRGARERSGL